MTAPPLLEVDRLSVSLGGRAVLHDVSFAVAAGEMVGIAGESGAGKSTLARAILGLTDVFRGSTTGSVRFEGRDFSVLPREEARNLRGRRLAMVFQDAVGALNPVRRVETQIHDVLRAHGGGDRVRERALGLLQSVGFADAERVLRLFPRQLSGGMAQRVVIALAIAHHPALLVADEATSSLDVTTQARVLDLFRRLNRDQGIALVVISHDLVVLGSLCQRLVILKDGRLVEEGPAETVVTRPSHPYTRELVASLPKLAWGAETPCYPEQGTTK